MYDAIVVGARCAGAPLSMLLARKGYRILLVDRASFPSDTISTQYIWLSGTACLNRWGLLDRLRATNCPPVREIGIDFGPFSLKGTPTPIDGVTEMFCPRRTVLDKLLVDAAAEGGADVDGTGWLGHLPEVCRSVSFTRRKVSPESCTVRRRQVRESAGETSPGIRRTITRSQT